jgi:succinylarginine dihydrolase
LRTDLDRQRDRRAIHLADAIDTAVSAYSRAIWRQIERAGGVPVIIRMRVATTEAERLALDAAIVTTRKAYPEVRIVLEPRRVFPCWTPPPVTIGAMWRLPRRRNGPA